MPSALREYQHELTTDYDGAPALFSLVFGTADTGYLTTTYPVIEGDEGENGDVQRFRDDGISMGEDSAGAKKATFEIGVLSDRAANRHEAGAELLDTFEAVWRDRRVREGSTMYAVLRSRQVGGRVRRTYGRPRRHSEQAGATTGRGMTPILCDFQSMDGVWYDDLAQSASSSSARSGIDGMLDATVLNTRGEWVFETLPATGGVEGYLPTIAIPTLDRQSVTIGGKKPTWPVVTFHAGSSSVLNPTVLIGDMRVELADTIPAGQSVTVDPRPWVRRVTRSDGANKSGKLSGRTPPLRRMMRYPGTYSFSYYATDPTGTSWAEVSWRNAYSRW